MNAADYYAKRRSVAVIELEDAEVELVARLAGKFKGLRTAAVIGAVYADPAVTLRLSDRAPKTRDRIAYISGLVVAEVAIARMQVAA